MLLRCFGVARWRTVLDERSSFRGTETPAAANQQLRTDPRRAGCGAQGRTIVGHGGCSKAGVGGGETRLRETIYKWKIPENTH